MQPVTSSAISHIGYDSATRVLTVRYKQGGEHEYAGVPSHVHAALMRAGSIGAFVNSHVKGKYGEPKTRG